MLHSKLASVCVRGLKFLKSSSSNRVAIREVGGIFNPVMSKRSGQSSRRGYGELAKQTNMRVLLDMDMVLADFEKHFLIKFRETYPDEPFVKLEDRNGFWLRDQYERVKPGLADKVRSIYNAEFFFRDLPEIPGALEAAREMDNMETVDVFICTSPLTEFEYCVKEKFQWVVDHLGVDWLEKLIITKDKTMVNGHILIDDRPIIRGVLKKPSWEHVVFSACHNIRTNIYGKTRLNNWTDGQWRTLLEDYMKRI